MLKNSNSIIVKFSEGKLGGVGAVVLRVGYLSSDKVSDVQFLPDSLKLYKGEEKLLKTQVLPQSAANKMLVWESLTPEILTVSENGVVKALENGIGKVMVKTVDANKTDTCVVNVSTLTISTIIGKSNWEVIWADNETTSSREAKENVIDDRTTTIWTTDYRGDSLPALPHEIWVDMKEETTLSKFQYLPRQDSRPNGTVGEYELYVSNDTLSWGEPVASGQFHYDHTQVYWFKEIQTIILSQPAKGRYFKFKALTEAQNIEELPITAVAEFYAYTPATGISIPSELNMVRGEELELPEVLSVPGDGLVDKSLITWSSSNPEIVSIGYGTLVAKSAGIAEVTVSTLGGQYSATAVVEVAVPTSIKEQARFENIKIYPNPVSGNQINFEFSTHVKNLSVKLYNVAGGLIGEDSFYSTSHAVLNLSRLNYKGMAIVKVVADNQLYTDKVIIQPN